MEETVREQLKEQSSTSQPSATTSPQIENVESRLSEIETTLSEFVQSLDGQRLNAASQSLIAEAQKSHAAAASAIEKLTVQADESRTLVSKVDGAMQRIEKRAAGTIDEAADRVADRVGVAVTAHQRTEGDRAERLQASDDRLEARTLWSAAAAMCLNLLPVAVVVVGVWMSVAGLISEAQWALDVDGSVWLGIGRWLIVGTGITGAGYALFVSVRWVTALVAKWKGAGMPKWSRWRHR